MAGQTAADEIDLFQLPRLQEQFFAARAGEKNIHRRINALIADLAIEHQLHVSGAFELLEDQLVHAAAGFDQCRRDDGERAGFFGVARRRENLSRSFHRARIDTAAHGAAAAAHRIVKCARRARDRVEQDKNMLARFDQTFGALDRELRDARVALDIAVVRARHDFGLGTGAPEIGHFFRPFIDQKNDQIHLRMILRHRVGDVMQQRRLARARRRDDQTALAHAERRHQIHDARGVTIRHRLELDPLVRIDRRQFFERPQALIFGRLFVIDLEQTGQLRTAIAAAGFAVNPHPVTQSKAAHDFRRDENILRRLHEIAFRIAQKSEAFAGNLDDAFAKFRLAQLAVLDPLPDSARESVYPPLAHCGRLSVVRYRFLQQSYFPCRCDRLSVAASVVTVIGSS